MLGKAISRFGKPSELGNFDNGTLRTGWNNIGLGREGPITCVCGKKWPRRKNYPYTVSTFLGQQIVEECCGGIIDQAFRECGETFTIRHLEQFAENPTDPQFRGLISEIRRILIAAEARLNPSEQRH